MSHSWEDFPNSLLYSNSPLCMVFDSTCQIALDFFALVSVEPIES